MTAKISETNEHVQRSVQYHWVLLFFSQVVQMTSGITKRISILVLLCLVGAFIRLSWMVGSENQQQLLLRLAASSSYLEALGNPSMLPSFDNTTTTACSQRSDELVSRFDHIRQNVVCQSIGSENTDLDIWQHLCNNSLLERLDERLLQGQPVKIVQIGAHYGFEHNDPMAEVLGNYLEFLSNDTHNNERERFQWNFIEASPSNFVELQKNLAKYQYLCDMVGIHAGIIPDGKEKDDLVFYAIRDTIDSETGYDSLSGKTVPFWISQISSFNRGTLMKHAGIFARAGLNINDYVVEASVTAKSYSTIMEEIFGTNENSINNPLDPPLFVMIDTEGFDCDILLGIAEDSPYWPEFLIFEHAHCRPRAYQKVREKMERLGYWWYKQPRRRQQNTLVIRTRHR